MAATTTAVSVAMDTTGGSGFEPTDSLVGHLRAERLYNRDPA